jgi:gliding motility-associated lipoprotein GldD
MRNFNFFLLLLICVLLYSCGNNEIPKPRGYFRIDFPEKKYVLSAQEACHFSFEVAVYNIVSADQSMPNEKCWLNVHFPIQRATIHLSYKQLNKNLVQYTEDSHALAYKHTAKAEAIEEELVYFPEKKVYGLIYHIEGNAASSIQFYLTDSIENFIRGALYFNAIPNKDSLAPVDAFIKEDIKHLINTFRWENH